MKFAASVAILFAIGVALIFGATATNVGNSVAAAFSGSGWEGGRTPVPIGLTGIDPLNYTAPAPVEDFVRASHLEPGEKTKNLSNSPEARAISMQLGCPRGMEKGAGGEDGRTFSRAEIRAFRRE